MDDPTQPGDQPGQWDGRSWGPQPWNPPPGQGGQPWNPPPGQQGGQPWDAPPGWGGGVHPAQRPSSMLPWSIAATLLCCLPLGVAGIVFAAKSDAAFAAGDMVGGMRFHGLARNFTIAAAAIAPILIGIALLSLVAVGTGETLR